MPNAPYDAIADSYRRSDATIIKDQVVKPVFLDMLGDVRGKHVIDLACGSGFATRLVKEAGAERVVGVDLSEKEIALARELERERPLGVEYYVGDVAQLDLAPLGEFDVATAVFLLPYAEGRAALEAMCRNVAACLRTGGRFVNVLPNPDVPEITDPAYQLTARMVTPGEEGSIRTLTYHPAGAAPISFDQYYWSRATYAAAVASAGFRTSSWIEFAVPAAAIERFGSEFWQHYVSAPHQLGLVAEI
jgi:SAM-dependent methyltransferase